MKKLQTSGTNTRKEQASRLKAAICSALNCTVEQYAQLVYAEGLKYLRYYLPDDKEGQNMINRSRVFWNWWKNHWATRDAEFKSLLERYPVNDAEIRLQLYLQYNDGKQLAENLHPQSVVMEESYSEMISELLQEECH